MENLSEFNLANTTFIEKHETFFETSLDYGALCGLIKNWHKQNRTSAKKCLDQITIQIVS